MSGYLEAMLSQSNAPIAKVPTGEHLKKKGVVKMEAIYWIDPYAKKSDKELDSYATCVIDGWAWRLTKELKTYCAGKVENLKRRS